MRAFSCAEPHSRPVRGAQLHGSAIAPQLSRGIEPDEPFLELWHGVDERISLSALRFGLPVLYDVVRRFCG